MVLQMENTRRSREPGAKKARLAGEPIRGVNPNGRPFPQRPAAPVAQRLRNVDRDSESNGGYEPQSLQQRNEELVNQYKTALAELTFNSKPIITNLTIIAGENLHAAKAIAATICSNIIEAPSDQKLPSLYLLDSIVKNIARDYIKYFGARLPVVFCKAYRQVDPPVCQSMRHLFGTWKGVFPLQPLQMIEKELGFGSANGSSGGAAISKPESQSQRTPHSIHVNPKYLERQRLEQSVRAKGMILDNGAISNSMEDIEKPNRAASFSVGRPWADAPVKLHSIQRRDVLSEPVHEKNVTAAYGDYEYGSDPPRNSGFGIDRTSGRVTDQGLEKPWAGASNVTTETITNQRKSFDAKHYPKYSVLKPADPRSRLLSTQNAAGRVGGGMSSSWKNSEEEEFMWDDMNSKLTDDGVANTSNDTRKDRWTPDEPERLGIKKQLQKPQSMHGIGSRFNREIAATSLSSEQKEQPIVGHKMLSSLSAHESHLMDERIVSQTAPVSSGHSEGFRPSFGGLPASGGSSIARATHRTQLGSSHVGSHAGFLTNAASRSGATMGHERFQSLGTSSPPGQSPMYQNSPSPSRSNPQNQYIPDILLGSLQKLQSQDSSHLSPSHQLRESYSSSQQLQSNISSVQPQKPLLPKVSNLGTSLKLESSASNHYSSLASEAPGQSITDRLTAVLNSGILSNNLISTGLPNVSFKDMGQTPSQSGPQPPLSGGLSHPQFTSTGTQVLSASSIGHMSIDNSSGRKNVSRGNVEQPPPSSLDGSVSPRTSNSTNPFSNLLSSLVSKGLISKSKKETPVVVAPPTRLQNESPGISSTSSDLASTDPVCAHVPATDEVALLEPAAIVSTLLTQPATMKIESLIGFEFKPEVIRELHPSVISGLFDDFPHRCSECGLRLKFEEQLDKHSEWHALKKPESLGLHRASRKWFVNPDNWVSDYIGFPDGVESAGSGEEEPAKTKKKDEPMVPADESQYACLLCGELFEDYYCVESDRWMFSGAVYMCIPSEQGTINGKAAQGPIVHANCISESSVLDLADHAIKMEVDS